MRATIISGIYVETDQRGANYGGIVTDVGIIVLDTPMVPNQAPAFRDELRRLSGGKPFLYVDQHRSPSRPHPGQSVSSSRPP